MKRRTLPSRKSRKSKLNQHKRASAARLSVEPLEPRVMLSGAESLLISGPDLITPGEDYLLNLTAGPALVITDWTIRWGDGSDPELIQGNPSTAVHQYAVGTPAEVAISATATANGVSLSAVLAAESQFDGFTIMDETGLFGTVRDVAVAGDGSLFLSETGQSAIHKRDANGDWAVFVPQGQGPDDLVNPWGLAIAGQVLYVSNSSTDRDQILKFDVSTGAPLGVFSSLNEFDNVRGLAFGPDGDLYVANLTANNVLRLDGTDGELMKTYSDEYLVGARDVAFDDEGMLYVSSKTNNRVLKFDVNDDVNDTESGTNFIWDDPGIPGDETGGLERPFGIGFGADGSFYVSSTSNKQLLKYDAEGAFLQVVRSEWTARGLTFGPGPDGDLYLAHGSKVDRLETNTDLGAEMIGYTLFPRQIAFDAEGDLYIADREARTLIKYEFATGRLRPVIGIVDGLADPWGVAVAPLELSPGEPHPAAGDVFVTSSADSQIFRLDVQTGAVEIVADSSIGFREPLGLEFGPDGNLYFTSNATGKVWRITFNDNGTVNLIEPLLIDDPNGLINSMTGLDFGPDGNLYIAQGQPHVLKYDMQSGVLSVFVDNAGWDFNNTHFDVRFGPDGDLYVAARIDENVLRYDGQTGQLIDIFAAHQPYRPLGLAFDSDGNLWTGSKEDGARVQKYTGPFEHEHDGNGDPLGVQVVAVGQIYDSNDVPKALKDAKGRSSGKTDSTLEINESFDILDVNVELDISHTWDADLDVFLTSPNGIEVELFTDVGGDSDNFTGTTLDDEAATSITSAAAPFTGVFRPEGQLSDFNGGSTSGTWTLRIEDDTKGIAGTLNSWSLTITYATPPPVAGISVTPTSGLVTGEDGTTDSFDVVLDTQPTADVTIGISSGDVSEGAAAPANLIFTQLNWNAPQTVTVTGVDDPDPDGDIGYTIVTAEAMSTDLGYNGLDAADVSVTNLDNETPAGVAVTGISPNTMSKGQTISGVEISGSGFAVGASVTFIGGSGRAPTASDVVVVDDGTITAALSAHRKAKASLWDVVVTNPDGSTGTCDGCFGVGVVPATAPAANQQFAMAAPLNEPTASSDTEPQRRSQRGAREVVFSRWDRTERAQRRARRAANTPLRRLQAVPVDRAMTDPAGHSRIARRGQR